MGQGKLDDVCAVVGSRSWQTDHPNTRFSTGHTLRYSYTAIGESHKPTTFWKEFSLNFKEGTYSSIKSIHKKFKCKLL